MPNYLCTFHHYMLDQGVKEATARTYARTMSVLFQEDGKSPSAMASDAYFQITKASFKNKSGNGQRSASVRKFMDFMKMHTGPLKDSGGATMYQVSNFRSKGGVAKSLLAAAATEGEEQRKLRAQLRLPDEWQVCVQARPSGDLVCAVSPGGTAYQNNEAVDIRLGRAEQSNAEAANAPAKTRRLRSHQEEKPVAKRGTKREKKEAGDESPEEANDEADEPIKGVMPLGEALQRLRVSPSTSRCVFVSGRDPAAQLTARLHGLYLQEGERDGRPLFQNVNREKPTFLEWKEERGVWRFCASLEAAGEFARVKEKKEVPWAGTQPWKVFNVSSNKHDEDPSLRVQLLQSSSLPSSATVEVSGIMPRPSDKAKGTKRLKTPSGPPGDASERPLVSVADAIAALGGPATLTDGQPTRDFLVISGVDPASRNAQRIRGIYRREDEAQGGRPCYTKLGASKPSILFFSAEKGRWRIAQGLNNSGCFAQVKDRALTPLTIQKRWKVYDGADFHEDPQLRLTALDLQKPPDLQVDQPVSSGTVPSQGPKAEPSNSKDLPEDAPQGHAAYQQVRFDPVSKRALFNMVVDGKKTTFQTTQQAAGGSEKAAEVIARACFVKHQEGKSKDEVTAFRNECYARLGGKDSKDDKDWDLSLEALLGTGKVSESKSAAAPQKPGEKQANSQVSSEAEGSRSGHSSESSAGEEEKTEVAKRDKPLESARPMGSVAAKMMVRRNIRCSCCYAPAAQCLNRR